MRLIFSAEDLLTYNVAKLLTKKFKNLVNSDALSGLPLNWKTIL